MTPPDLALDLRLILAAVFLIAGVSKLMRGKGDEEDLLFAAGFGKRRAESPAGPWAFGDEPT